MRRAYLALVGLACATTAAAQHDHSQQNPEKLGSVRFATSCSPAVASQFNRAVALLHSFEFGASIKGFESVLAVDSTCAMAHWGIAMSRWSNPMAAANRPMAQLATGKKSADAAARLSSRVTPRERGYIDAVARLYANYENTSQLSRLTAYQRAMEALSASEAKDTEARIFYALSLAASAPPEDKTYANQKKAGAILEALWKLEPQHPGLAHYIIHSYDYPALAAQANVAARNYATIAPSAAHALHMPSHIFTRTGSWKESIETNLRSMKIALGTGSIGEALHAADYAGYAYLQLGENAKAKALVDSLPGMVARFDVNAITGAAPGSAGVFAIAAIPARFALERAQWSEAAALEPYASDFPWTAAMTYFARSLGASRTGDMDKARSSIDSLESIRRRLAEKDETYWSEQVAIQEIAARAWADLKSGRKEEALTQLREAAQREDATEKSAVTPGPLAPAHEMLGDMLMELQRPVEALAEYQKTLEKEPNRRRALLGGIAAAKLSKNDRAASELTRIKTSLGIR